MELYSVYLCLSLFVDTDTYQKNVRLLKTESDSIKQDLESSKVEFELRLQEKDDLIKTLQQRADEHETTFNEFKLQVNSKNISSEFFQTQRWVASARACSRFVRRNFAPKFLLDNYRLIQIPHVNGSVAKDWLSTLYCCTAASQAMIKRRKMDMRTRVEQKLFLNYYFFSTARGSGIETIVRSEQH